MGRCNGEKPSMSNAREVSCWHDRIRFAFVGWCRSVTFPGKGFGGLTGRYGCVMSGSDVEFVVIFQQQGPLGRVQRRRVGLWFDDHPILQVCVSFVGSFCRHFRVSFLLPLASYRACIHVRSVAPALVPFLSVPTVPFRVLLPLPCATRAKMRRPQFATFLTS